MSIISTNGLVKIYDEKTFPIYATNDISLSFEKGEFSAIVGPSGCGKTTLLNLLGGLETPTSGEIIIDNNIITKLKSSELIDFRLHNIGFVFQAYNLIPVLSAKENVEFIMHLQNYSKSERNNRVEELLLSVGLKDKMNKRPSELSGGEQQRVAVARALASKPKFILADEPTANLDTNSSREILELFKKLNKEMGQTIVLVTHEPDDRKYVDRVIWIKDGLLEREEKNILKS